MIGYYIHHHGRGHSTRARTIAAASTVDVVALTSLPRPDDIAPFVDWVHLDRDDADIDAAHHSAHGALHYAPLRSPGYRARMHRLAGWLADAAPQLVVVDVSIEVTTLCRLLGVPVVVVAGAGTRSDAPHQLAYRLAETILAPWPGDLYRPSHLDPFDARTRYLGAMSRFDARPPSRSPGTGRVLVLPGAGGFDVAADEVAAARAATPGWVWSTPGTDGERWSDDVWTDLTEVDVVVTHAGMNALAEVAAARRPAVVLPQARPFDEQVTTAQVLRAHGIATVLDEWPTDPAAWTSLLADTAVTGGGGWAAWNDGGGARRAADALAETLLGLERTAVDA